MVIFQERAFNMKQAFFITFKQLSIVINCLRPKEWTLKMGWVAEESRVGC